MVSILGMMMCVVIKFNYINNKEELENLDGIELKQGF
jgi:hypothetical protein